MATEYIDEKLPLPVTARPEPPKRTFLGTFFLFLLRTLLLGTFLLILSDTFEQLGGAPNAGTRSVGAFKHGCHRMRKHAGHKFAGVVGGDRPRHHRPDTSKWVPVEATKHFELSPEEAKGLSIKGSNVFGGIVFETSKLSDKVVLDLDLKTNVALETGEEITVNLIDGKVEINTPLTGDRLKTHASAKILVPSNLIGTFGLPSFEVDAPRHMVDLSGLPESLEVGSLVVRLAKGFIKAGKVHTNTTQLTIAKGAIRGDLKLARDSTSIDVSAGNVTIKIDGISSGETGSLNIKLASGHLKGSFPVYKSTTLDVAKGSIDATIYVEAANLGEDGKAELSSKVGSGDARINVKSIAEGAASLDAAHTAIAGTQVLTYPESFEGTIEARGLVGEIKLAGEGLVVERAWFGSVGKKGDETRNLVKVKAAKGDIDVLVGRLAK